MDRPTDRAALFDVLPDACLVLTPDLVMVDANHAFCTMLERHLDQLVGRRIAEVFPVNPKDPAAATRLTSAYRAELAQVREAMVSRSVIEQAKGVLMGQRRCSEPDAFAILVTLSQDSNRKLRDVCAAVVAQAVPAVASSGCGPCA